MKMFAFVQLFLGHTSLSSMPARFFDPCGSEPVLIHSGFHLLLRWWETQHEAPIIHPNSHICLSFKCISIVHVTPSCNKHLETDGLFPSRVQCVTLPRGREGKALGSKHSWCQSWNPSYLGGGDRGRQAVQSLGSSGNSRMTWAS